MPSRNKSKNSNPPKKENANIEQGFEKPFSERDIYGTLPTHSALRANNDMAILERFNNTSKLKQRHSITPRKDDQSPGFDNKSHSEKENLPKAKGHSSSSRPLDYSSVTANQGSVLADEAHRKNKILEKKQQQQLRRNKNNKDHEPESILKSLKPQKNVSSKIPAPTGTGKTAQSRTQSSRSDKSSSYGVGQSANTSTNGPNQKQQSNTNTNNQHTNSTGEKVAKNKNPTTHHSSSASNNKYVRPQSDRTSEKTNNKKQAEMDLKNLLRDNHRLKKENMTLRGDQQQHHSDQHHTSQESSQPHAQSISVVNDPKAHMNERSDIYQRLKDLTQENQNLREKNAELVLLQNRADKNYEHIKNENSDLKTRILHLERVVSITHTPQSVSATSANGNKEFGQSKLFGRDGSFDSQNSSSKNFMNFRDTFSRETQQSHKNGISSNTAGSNRHDDNIISILSQKRVISGHGNVTSKDKKKAALRSMNSLASTLDPTQGDGNMPEERERLPNSSYLRKHNPKSPRQSSKIDKSIVSSSSKSLAASLKAAEVVSPRTVNIIKPKPKINNESNYSSKFDQVRTHPKLVIPYSHNSGGGDNFIPTKPQPKQDNKEIGYNKAHGFRNFVEIPKDTSASTDQSAFYSVLKKKQKPAALSAVLQNSLPINGNKETQPLSHFSNKLDNLSSMNKTMRNDIKELESQIRLLNKKS